MFDLKIYLLNNNNNNNIMYKELII